MLFFLRRKDEFFELWHCNGARAVPARVKSRQIRENSPDFTTIQKKVLKLRKKFWSVQADSIADSK
jgi:hypothetical protein